MTRKAKGKAKDNKKRKGGDDSGEPPERRCVLCNEMTQEKKVRDAVLAGNDKKKYRLKNAPVVRVMKCDNCQSSACSRCATAFPVIMATDGLRDENCPIVRNMNAFTRSTDDVFLVPGNESHCCMYRIMFKKQKDASYGSQGNSPNHVEPSEVAAAADSQAQSLLTRDLDGLLNYAQNRSLIDSSFKHPDVVSAGQAMHSLTQPGTSLNMKKRGVLPDTSDGNHLANVRFIQEHTHPITGVTAKLKIRVTMLKNYATDNEVPGTFLERDEDVRNQFLTMTEKQCDKERKKHSTDVWIQALGECICAWCVILITRNSIAHSCSFC